MEILLVGGPHDGRRINMGSHRPDGRLFRRSGGVWHKYVHDGSASSDAEHVYRHVPDEPKPSGCLGD